MASALPAQEYTFTTLAGPDESPGAIDGPISVARFGFPASVSVDNSGNLYVADTLYNILDGGEGNYTIRKLTPSGLVTTLAGLAGNPGSADGTGGAARFSPAYGIALDSAANVYVADTGNHTIRKITPDGVVTTLAGLAGTYGTNDGTGSAARFFYPEGVSVDSAGNVYVADKYNNTIRKITPMGVVTTLAGLAGSSGTNDATSSAARFASPMGVAVDTAGNLYVADTFNYTIRKITPSGEVTTLAGLAGTSDLVDGTGSDARFFSPSALAMDSTGSLFVTDGLAIRQVSPDGVVTTLAGPPQLVTDPYGSADGTGSDARFFNPKGVAVDKSGNIFVADTGNGTLRQVTPDGTVTTLAGIPRLAAFGGYADGSGKDARFGWGPNSVAVDRTGNAYVIENGAIRQVTPDGTVTTLAMPDFGAKDGVAVDGTGNVYVADTGYNTILRVTPDGSLTTLAGCATCPVGSANGTGSVARFNEPTGVAVGSAGDVFVADNGNNTIRKMTPAGVVTTLAGLARSSGTNDGTGSAARFSGPYGVAVDSQTNVYVADSVNYAIRKITPAGVVTTLAGGQYGGVDGIGRAARFWGPRAVAVDSTGNVYVTDYGFLGDGSVSTIRKVTPAGIATTLTSLPGVSGYADGTGSTSQFLNPLGVAVDSTGRLYVADTGNRAIRVGTPNACPDRPTIDLAVAPVGLTRQLDTSPQTAVAWQWSLIRQPSASSAKLSAVNVRNPTFTPDVADLYVFRLFATNAAGAICIRTLSFIATLQPLILQPSTTQANGQFGFTLLSHAGSAVEIQTSTNLLAWTTLTTLTNVTGTLPFTDPATSFNQRFYRAHQLP